MCIGMRKWRKHIPAAGSSSISAALSSVFLFKTAINRKQAEIFSSRLTVILPRFSMAIRMLFALSCLLLFSSFSSASRISLPSDSDKVSLALYYESLCPYSANFIVNYLVKLFEGDLISIVDLRLVPYGNARIYGNNTITCQHGPNECLLNTVEACAIDVWPQLNEHFPFIHCVETLVYEHKYLEWESCFQKLGLDSKPITDCYSSGHGKELELEYAAETDALKPPHKYVPWVVVNGQPLYEDYENFISYICKAYKGSTVPRGCSKTSFNRIFRGKSSNQVCYKETRAQTIASRIQSAVASFIQRMEAV